MSFSLLEGASLCQDLCLINRCHPLTFHPHGTTRQQNNLSEGIRAETEGFIETNDEGSVRTLSLFSITNTSTLRMKNSEMESKVDLIDFDTSLCWHGDTEIIGWDFGVTLGGGRYLLNQVWYCFKPGDQLDLVLYFNDSLTEDLPILGILRHQVEHVLRLHHLGESEKKGRRRGVERERAGRESKYMKREITLQWPERCYITKSSDNPQTPASWENYRRQSRLHEILISIYVNYPNTQTQNTPIHTQKMYYTTVHMALVRLDHSDWLASTKIVESTFEKAWMA